MFCKYWTHLRSNLNEVDCCILYCRRKLYCVVFSVGVCFAIDGYRCPPVARIYFDSGGVCWLVTPFQTMYVDARRWRAVYVIETAFVGLFGRAMCTSRARWCFGQPSLLHVMWCAAASNKHALICKPMWWLVWICRSNGSSCFEGESAVGSEAMVRELNRLFAGEERERSWVGSSVA